MSSRPKLIIRDCVLVLQRYAHRLWYPPLIGFLAMLDNFAVVIPTDGILISSSMLTPKRWFILGLSVTVGSTLGALVLAALIEQHGLPWIIDLYPNIEESKTWLWTEEFFKKYGLLVVFIVAATPFFQQPAIILASLANTSLVELALVIFSGRFIKFLAMAYIASHAPRLLKRVWGIGGELKDVGATVK